MFLVFIFIKAGREREEKTERQMGERETQMTRKIINMQYK